MRPIPNHSDKADTLLAAVSAISETDGMPTAAIVQYLIIDENGDERIGGFYTGGLMNAVGLLAQGQDELLDQFRGWDEDE